MTKGRQHPSSTPARPSLLVPFHTALEKFRKGTDTPRDFLERCIARLEELEPQTRAFVALAIPRSRMAADAATLRWRKGQPWSPVDGMPVGVKDVIGTYDMPTALGSPAWEGWQSRIDSAAVMGLREAGAFVLGKTKTTEFAFTSPTDTRNPVASGRTPGGSSSGSAAAVAAGILPAALGTQVGGSILRPASFCGTIGYKPTFGAINRSGCQDFLSQSCIGVLAASLTDAWTLAQAIARRAGGDPGALGLIGNEFAPKPRKPKRLAVLHTAGWAIASPGAKAAFNEAIASLAAKGIAVVLPGSDAGVAELEQAVAGALDLTWTLNKYEMRWQVKGTAYRDRLGVSPDLLKQLDDVAAMTLEEYRVLLGRREAARAVMERVGVSFDGLLALSAPGAAPEGLRSTGNPICNAPASFLGTPALSLPMLADEGWPLGLQLLGRKHTDEALFATAAWIASVLGAGTE